MKGVGSIAANSILAARNKIGGYKSLNDLLSNIDTFAVNKRVFEAMIQVGALDSFGYSRKCLFESVDSILTYASKENERKSEGQGNLFLGSSKENYSLHLPKQSEEWDSEERLKREKAICGLYLSGHPLDKYKKKLDCLTSIFDIEKVDTFASGTKLEVCGIVSGIQIKLTKKKEEFANFKLADYSGEIDCTAFPKVFAKIKPILKEDKAIFIKGFLDKIEQGEAELRGQIIVNEIEELTEESVINKLEKSLHIILDMKKFLDNSIVNILYTTLKESKGSSVVYFHLQGDASFKKVIKVHNSYFVEINKDLTLRLGKILGNENIFYTVGDELLNLTS